MLSHKKIEYLSIIIAFTALCLAVSVRSVMASSDIVLIASIGQVEIKSQQAPEWKKVSSDTSLHYGDVVRTGPQSKAEIRFESGNIWIYENTILEIPSKVEQLTVSDKPVKLKNVLLMKGHSLFQIIKNRLEGEFEVISPSLIAGVKGTTFSVVEEEKEKGVTVFEGFVIVANRQFPAEVIEVKSNHYTLLKNEHLAPAREIQRENVLDSEEVFVLEHSGGAVPTVSSTLPAIGGALPTVSSTLPAIGGALPTVSSTLPAIGGALPTVSSTLPAVGGALPTVSSTLPAAGGALPTVSSALPAGGGALPTVSSALPAVGNALPLGK